MTESQQQPAAEAMPDPRTVAYVVRTPFVSGAERTLLRAAPALDPSRYRPFVIANPSDALPRALSEAELPHRLLRQPLPDRYWPFPFLASVASLSSELIRRSAAIVHANDAPACPSAAVAARVVRRPLICHLHFTYDADGLRWYLKRGFARAVFPSRFLMRDAQNKCPDLFPDARCQVIHGGFDPAPPPEHQSLATRRHELSLDPSDRILGFFGQVIAIKGVREYLMMAKRLLDREPLCRFLIVGDDQQPGPSYRLEMEDLARGLGIAHACRFTGYREDVWELLHLCDVVIMPSHVEPFGNVAMEAGAAARPVVAGDVGGLREIVNSGETGLLVAPHDPEALSEAVSGLLSSEERRRDLGHHARERIRSQFSINKHVGYLADLYDEVLGERSANRGERRVRVGTGRR